MLDGERTLASFSRQHNDCLEALQVLFRQAFGYFNLQKKTLYLRGKCAQSVLCVSSLRTHCQLTVRISTLTPWSQVMTLHHPDLTQIPFSLLLSFFFYLFSFSYACLFLCNLGRPQNHYAALELTTAPPSAFQNLGYVFEVCTITTRSNVNFLIMPTHTHPRTKTGFHILALSIPELRPVK